MYTDDLVEQQEFIEQFQANIQAKEKVALFIDNSNLYGAIQSLPELAEKRMDYIHLKSFLANGRTINTAMFYYSEPPAPKATNREAMEASKKRQGFYYVLEKSGYNTVCLPQRQTCKGFSEKGLDTALVYDMCALSRDGRYDTFILVAGDEDYARSVKKIREDTGINVEVVFFSGENCSYKLQEVATKFIDLREPNTFKTLFKTKEEIQGD